MPLFDYHCPACDRDFEFLVRGSARAECPACGSLAVERKLALPARPAGEGGAPDFSRLGPPPGGCCGGACGHSH